VRRFGKLLVIGIVGLLVLCVVVSVTAYVGKGTTPQTARQPTANAPAAQAATPAPVAAVTAIPAAPAVTAAPTAAPQAATVGQDVKVGDVRWKVLSAKDEGKTLKSDNQFIKDKTTVGKWIRLRVEIENQSKDQLLVTGVDLKDDQDRTFKASSEVYAGFIPNEEACALSQLNANVPKTCQFLYELPADAKGLQAIVGDLKPFGAKDVAIQIGL
jgi:hypothetical protein